MEHSLKAYTDDVTCTLFSSDILQSVLQLLDLTAADI